MSSNISALPGITARGFRSARIAGEGFPSRREAPWRARLVSKPGISHAD